MTELIKKCFDERIAEKLLEMYKSLSEEEKNERIMKPKELNPDLRKIYNKFDEYWTLRRCYVDMETIKAARNKYRSKFRYAKDKEKMKAAAKRYYQKQKEDPDGCLERRIEQLRLRMKKVEEKRKKAQDEIDYISEELEKALNI